jgi:hypothetical protein
MTNVEGKSYNKPEKKTIWEMSDKEFRDFMRNAKTCDEVWKRV